MSDVNIIVTMVMCGGTMGIILMAMWAITISQVWEKVYLYSYLSALAVGIIGITCGVIRNHF